LAVPVQKIRHLDPPVAYPAAPARDDEGVVERWPRRSRFLFIVGAASLCWAVPAAVVYWLVLPH
jgi:hypothetical protein